MAFLWGWGVEDLLYFSFSFLTTSSAKREEKKVSSPLRFGGSGESGLWDLIFGWRWR